MNDKLLDIENLYAVYDTDEAIVYALNGVNLSLKKGESLGLVGETGAGKTTMALSILRLLPKNVGKIKKGNITYNGIDIINANHNKMREIRGGKIAMIFQDPMTSLNPIITVGEQIHEALDLHFSKMSRDEKDKRVDEILELVGIQKNRKSDYPHQFSGGMKQRIGIAMALVAKPELLIADEPTTALDVTIQAQILRLMQELQKQYNTAMILITHNLGIVAEFCENVAVMYCGEIIEKGSVEDVFSKKNNHPYTEGLFNSIPDLVTEADRLIPIPGFMADPTNLPKGCKFAERCSHCSEKCKNAEPPMITYGTHSIKCYLFEEKGGEK
jgi:peptide/nickel transport system ATP-binding protein